MDLKDVIASDRKEGAIEFANWLGLKHYYTFKNKWYLRKPGVLYMEDVLIANSTEELYNIYINEQSI